MISFVSDPQSARFHEAYVAHIHAVCGAEQLLAALSAALQFPSGFGMNWNALIDFLSDLHWMKQRRVVIVHDELPDLSRVDLADYLGSVLFAMTRDIDRPGSHDEFDVVFPIEAHDVVQRAIRESIRNDGSSVLDTRVGGASPSAL